MKRGFTLLELIVVIIIIGILAALGFAQFTTVIEKSRAGEAKLLLGQLRTAQTVYVQQYGGTGTDTITNLPVDVASFPASCVAGGSTYFSYACATTGTCTATRCGTGTGKNPGYGTAYTINLTTGGVLSGSDSKFY